MEPIAGEDYMLMTTFYTNRGETFYNVGPFSSDRGALQYINKAHKTIPGGISSVSITVLNLPETDPDVILSGGDCHFDDASPDEEYHFVEDDE